MDFIIPSPLIIIFDKFISYFFEMPLLEFECVDSNEDLKINLESLDKINKIDYFDDLISILDNDDDKKLKVISSICNIAGNMVNFITYDQEERELLRDILSGISKLNTKDLKETLTCITDSSDYIKDLELENKYLRTINEINKI